MVLSALVVLAAALSSVSAYYPDPWTSQWDTGNWRDVFLGNDPYTWETGRYYGKHALFNNELNILDPQIRAFKRAERAGLLPTKDYLFNPTTGPWRRTDPTWETEKLWEDIDQKRGGCRRWDLVDLVNPWRRDYEYQLGGDLLGDLTTSPFNTWNTLNRWDWPETNRWQERQLEKEIVRDEILREEIFRGGDLFHGNDIIREEILREELDQPRWYGRKWRGIW